LVHPQSPTGSAVTHGGNPLFCGLLYKIQNPKLAVLGSVHGVDKIEAGLSDFYLVDDIHGIYRGMMIAIPPVHWQCFEDFTDIQMVEVLQHLATKVHLKSFRKHPRSPKKK